MTRVDKVQSISFSKKIFSSNNSSGFVSKNSSNWLLFSSTRTSFTAELD